jgi:anti-anti-sigma regulatory factor
MTTEPESARPLLCLSGYHLGAFRVVELSGDCDIATAQALRDGLAQALGDPDRGLIVDMSRVSFCDGESAATILVAGSGRRLAVVGVSGITGLVFDILDPTEQVPRYRSVDAAAWSLSGLP